MEKKTWEFSVHELPANRQYYGIDLLKFLFAYLVVSIHVKPLSTFLDDPFLSSMDFVLRQYLARIAVPFYFASAGFLLFRKTDEHNFDFSPCKNYVFKILRLFGTWMVVLFVGEKHHLWYMGGLVVAVLTMSLFLWKGWRIESITILSAALYIVGLCGDSYFGMLELIRSNRFVDIICKIYRSLFGTTRNGLFMGMMFLSLGVLFAYRPIIMSKGKALFGAAVSFALLGVEAFTLQFHHIPIDNNMYLLLPVVIFFLFYIATHIQFKQSGVYRKIRVVGVVVFYSHLLVYRFVEMFFKGLSVTGIQCGNSLVAYGLTCIGASVLGIILERLSNTKRFSLLKYLWT